MPTKEQLINNLLSPFSRKRDLPFSDFVKSFTKGITRLHYYNGAYDLDDLSPNMRDFISEHDYMNGDIHIELKKCPKTYKQLSMDNPIYSWEMMNAVIPIQQDSKDTTQQLLRKTFLRRYFDVGIPIQEWWETYEDVEYTIDSLGLRNKNELETFEDNNYIPVFGCSHTFGFGTPENKIWYNYLNEQLPIYNLGIASGSPTDVYLILTQLFKEKPFSKTYIVIPHKERTSHISNKGVIEGALHYQEDLVPQFNGINEIFTEQHRLMYSDIVIQAIVDFCKVNNIELKMYCRDSIATHKDFAEWNLVAPFRSKPYKKFVPELQLSNPKIHSLEELREILARDLGHYGNKWHRKIAETLNV